MRTKQLWPLRKECSLDRDKLLFGETLRCRHLLDCLKKLGLTRWPRGDDKLLGNTDKCRLLLVLKCLFSTGFVTISKTNNTLVLLKSCHYPSSAREESVSAESSQTCWVSMPDSQCTEARVPVGVGELQICTPGFAHEAWRLRKCHQRDQQGDRVQLAL